MKLPLLLCVSFAALLWSGAVAMASTGEKPNIIYILFDLESDPAETRNLASKHPEIVANLSALVQKYIDTGRSTPGAPQKNNGEIFLYPQWIRKGRQGI